MLCVARTFTSAVAVLEAAQVLGGDARIQVVFTVDDTSAFSDGTLGLLRDHQVRLLPWEQALRLRPALVLTASENVDLTGFSAPVTVLPHGVGFHKWVPDSRGATRRLSGVPRPELAGAGNLRLTITHPGQREELRRHGHTAFAERCDVVGDPAYDRLRASLRHRERYRRRLGVESGQRLVLLTSTWGRDGLLGSDAELPARLTGALDYDRHRVAAVLHPNIWDRHSPWQVRHLLREALDAGLILIPPDAGWGTALVAADCVIGDHGSVTLYGAALDRPILIGAFASDIAVAGTALARLAAHTARLDPAAALAPQVTAAITGHTPGRYADVASGAFAHPDRAHRRLARLLYRRMGLDPPLRDPPVRALPPPDPQHTPALAFDVHTRLTATGAVCAARYPAAARPRDPARGYRHLAVAESCPDRALARSASTVYTTEVRPPEEALAWAEAALEDYPGCVVAAAASPDGCLAAIRGRAAVRVRARAEAGLLAAVVYTLLRAGRMRSGRRTLRAGAAEYACRLLQVGARS